MIGDTAPEASEQLFIDVTLTRGWASVVTPAVVVTIEDDDS